MPNHLLKHSPAGIGGLLTDALGGPGRGGNIARAVRFNELGDLMERVSRSSMGHSVFEKLLEELEVKPCLRDQELRRIPASGHR